MRAGQGPAAVAPADGRDRQGAGREPRILILDEATSALTAADVATIFAVLKRLRAEGLALLYISHRMHEIAELADECTVFRNGRNVATYRGRRPRPTTKSSR